MDYDVQMNDYDEDFAGLIATLLLTGPLGSTHESRFAKGEERVDAEISRPRQHLINQNLLHSHYCH